MQAFPFVVVSDVIEQGSVVINKLSEFIFCLEENPVYNNVAS
jgi:hypothetical protein